MNMIEKVARAIYEADDVWSAAFPWPIMPSKEQSADNYRMIARAAIEAMREPTKEMIEAGYQAMDDGVDFYNYESDTGYIGYCAYSVDLEFEGGVAERLGDGG